MLLVIILIVIGVIGLTVFLRLWKRHKEKEAETRDRAAQRLIKEEQLKNRISVNGELANNEIWKLLLEMSWKEKSKETYVLDPKNSIRFGRSPLANDVVIDNEKISAVHCVIYEVNNRLYVQDLSSSNGTFLERNRKRYRLSPNADLRDGDVLNLCGTRFTIHPFFYNVTKV